MSKTTYHYFTGKCMWAKVSAPGDQKNEKYSINLFLSSDDVKVFNKLKIRNKLRMDDEGKPYVSFSRKFSKMIKGELVQFGEPALYDKEGVQFMNDRPSIGNGSTVTVKISVYETSYEGVAMNGHRLEAVKIVDLVEYNPTPRSALEGLPF